MRQQSAGARYAAGAGTVTRNSSNGAVGRPTSVGSRPIGSWAFAGVAVASFGGPLALAALIAPGVVDGAVDSAGLAMIAAAVVFVVPLAIWLRYSRHVSGSGGLYSFVEAAAGRRVALVQAAIWTFSYLLYVIYTTVQIVYDLLPVVVPGVRAYQSLLALLIPVAVAAVMIAGRTAALLVIGAIAAAQVVLAGVLDGVTLTHLSTPASTFGTGAPAGSLAKASAQTSLLYICGSLPLFLGGELAAPGRTIRRGLIGAFVLTALVVLLAVAPLAAAPGLTWTAIPGVSVVAQFSGSGLAKVSRHRGRRQRGRRDPMPVPGADRLLHAVGSWRMRPIAIAIGALLVLVAPFSLINPDGFYNTSDQALADRAVAEPADRVRRLPRFAHQRGQRVVPASGLGIFASAFAVTGSGWR